MPEPKLSSFETVLAAFTFVATFALGYEHWRMAVRQDEQDARIERRREEFERSLFSMEREQEDRRAADQFELQLVSIVSPHLGKLREPGREGAASQKIVAAAAEILSSRGRPALSRFVEKIRDESAPRPAPEPEPELASASAAASASSAAKAPAPVASASPATDWFVLLATLPGTDRKAAEQVANEKLRAAKELGMMPVVSIYKTKLKGRYVVALGKPGDRSAAFAAAAQARRSDLAPDAFAEPDGGWELTGIAPFPTEVRSASVP